MMKLYRRLNSCLIAMVLICGIAGCGTSYPVVQEVQYANPAWAPAYTNGVRYYYLPDIETYYDLSNNDFAYMDNGQWIFSRSLPSLYNNYDLYNGFTISLNSNVYQPWMHHQYYTSNYPRYYYRAKYQGTANNGIRGFNENSRQPVSKRIDNNNRPGEIKNNEPNNGVRNTPATRPAQNPVFRGKNLGEPVKVKPNMRQAGEHKNRGKQSGGNNNNNKNEKPQ